MVRFLWDFDVGLVRGPLRIIKGPLSEISLPSLMLPSNEEFGFKRFESSNFHNVVIGYHYHPLAGFFKAKL